MAGRAHNAVTSQLNPVDLTRRSPSYEMRLAKYAKRGFEVAVPDLQRSRVDPMIFERAWSNINGLARLLLLEKLTTPEERFQYKERHRAKKVCGAVGGGGVLAARVCVAVLIRPRSHVRSCCTRVCLHPCVRVCYAQRALPV